MAEAKVDILRPDSRKPNAEQEWKLVRWRLGPQRSHFAGASDRQGAGRIPANSKTIPLRFPGRSHMTD